ncbi:MAG: SDR family NAD(P)-dependent oxidoreductase [Myxococcota bacterium]|nr:SDR family NAD(P)-dependent oxidoreductase [Myxococcota bacterium]
MSQDLRFDGKVAVVTGAGNGLGRSHALELARRGAKVVVNDLGGSHTGEGASATAADKVVAEIEEAGGEAVANHDSVENGAAIIRTAIDAFGRVDILINNAGILRDVSFQKMTEQDWDLVYRVHVKGAFACTHAAWPYMRDQKYGRILFTASAAGIYGNFGQANYAMAKLGLVGLSNTLAIEGRKNNVIVNTIAPVAGSRMTETVLPQNLLDALQPEYVTALVVELSHESHEDTGGLYEVGGGFYGKLRWERTEGKTFRLGRKVSAEDVREAMKDIASFERTTHPAHLAESLDPIMKNVEAGVSKGGNAFIDVDAALGYEFPEMRSKYDERDLAIYALGVGAANDPSDDRDLQLVYEMHGAGFKALPTFGVIPAINCILTMGKEGKTAPGMKYGLDRVLHGEQYLELVRPLPAKQKLTHKARVKDIFDKGSDGGKKGGAVVITAIDSYGEDGELLIRNEVSTFVRGAGGWGGDRGPSAEVNVAPDRAPDARVEQKIDENQALLYRLSGDWNPLHADPGFAKAFGFERPILHGLCTFGYAARHVISSFAKDGDPRFFKSIKVRFADPVIPGETIVTEMWKESDTKIVFRVKSKERDKVVISNAAIELFLELPKPKEKAKPVAAATASASASAEPISSDVFGGIAAYVAKNPDAVGKVKTVYQFQLKSPDSVWTIDLKNGAGAVAQGETAPPECTLEMSDADFMDMCTGKADAMKLFTTGKLKISGNVMASQKLDFLKKVDPNDVMAAAQKRGGGGGTSAAAAAPSAEPTSADVFGGIARYVAKTPDAVSKVKTVYAFKLKDPDAVWTIDLKNGAGSVAKGETAPPECTLEMGDADFLDMCTGKADAMKLFTTGKLKISGNVMASQKLDFLKKVDPSDVAAAMKERGAGGAVPAASASEPKSAAPAKSALAPSIFDALSKRIAGNAGLVKEVGATIEFRVKDPEGTWTVDLKSGAGSVAQGGVAQGGGSADTTVTISDADLQALASGTASPQALYQQGKLRVDGDVRIAQRLGFLNKLA